MEDIKSGGALEATEPDDHDETVSDNDNTVGSDDDAEAESDTHEDDGSDDEEDLVSIIVSDGTAIPVNKELLIANSDFAAARFSGGWSDGRPPVLELPDFGTKEVILFTRWISKDWSFTSSFPGWDALLQCYFLGDFLQAREFRAHVMTSLYKMVIEEKWECSYASDTNVNEVYSRTTRRSILRVLMVDIRIYQSGTWLASAAEFWSDHVRADFYEDVLEELTWRNEPERLVDVHGEDYLESLRDECD